MADNDFFVKVNKVSDNIDSLLEVGQKVENIDTKISDINDKHSLVIQTKEAIDAIKQEIDIKNSEIKNLNVETLLLATGSNPSIDYNSSTGKLTIGIPKGDKGDKGDTGATGAGVTDNQTAIIGMGLWANTANIQKIKIEGVN
jgi:hypothetical protein